MDGEAPDTPGWVPAEDYYSGGQVRFHVTGAYARALAVAAEARDDPAFARTSRFKTDCFDAGTKQYWLEPNEKRPTVEVDGCIRHSDRATHADRAFAERARRLEADLRKAIGTGTLIPNK